MTIERKKVPGEREPNGGWLGPATHNWPDLPERDKPSFMRGPNPRPACPRPPVGQRWEPKSPEGAA